jgi:hypothetical protein
MKYSIIEKELFDRIQKLEEKVEFLEKSRPKLTRDNYLCCEICGISTESGVWGYVCHQSQCPFKVTCKL